MMPDDWNIPGDIRREADGLGRRYNGEIASRFELMTEAIDEPTFSNEKFQCQQLIMELKRKGCSERTCNFYRTLLNNIQPDYNF